MTKTVLPDGSILECLSDERQETDPLKRLDQMAEAYKRSRFIWEPSDLIIMKEVPCPKTK